MLITLLKILFTPSKFCSHHLFSGSHRNNFVHTIKILFTLWKFWVTPSKFCSHQPNAKIMNMWYKTCRHHTDLHCSHTVGINNTHIRWNQVFVVWPSYVSVQNKFVWVWLPQMDANMLHERFVRPWWDSTAWTVEYSRIQFMHWYSWRDITPWHFSAVRIVGEGHRHHRSIYKECVNILWLQ